ncbi:hypothetical protein jhhlp_008429 [Lomentospora prolificans]|uniref:Copper-fist domain-containing protein n=1 Tax=Lomentospora prolificans TaxID=41688 RepID=A0A2N3MY15_9PEZI|nr:hypothetical protein jhhlp_008429 [Lomentospora prolificans]
MIIDGEKYACEACVRGHRVSNCQHSDRPLQHINKKGRPVSQCAHCRAMRKSRSAHVKCDCGIKPSKCIHLQPTLEGHTQTCCCNHGGACSCSHKLSPSSEASTPPQLATGELAQARHHTKATGRARRASLVTSPTFPGVQKHTTQSRAALKNRAPVSVPRTSSLARRRRSSGALHTLNGSVEHEASGDTTPDNSTEDPGSPILGDVAGAAMSSHPAPLDMSRIARYPLYMHTANAGFDLFNATSFADTESPLFSAGLPTSSNMWGNLVTPTYNTMHPNIGAFFDFPAPEQGEQSLDQLPNLVATSGEVSEADEGHPEDLGAEQLFQGLENYDTKRSLGQPEILDDMGDLNFNFNDEYLAMGYGESSSTDKPAEYHQYWPPSP